MKQLAAVAAALVALTVPTAAAISSNQSSTGAAVRVRVPNLVGQRLHRAETILKRAGLAVGLQTCSCTFGTGEALSYVCVQRPRAGAVVARGTPVSTFSVRARSDC
jgi:beta-lactam-binding protein with PASTA domain